MVFKTMLSGDIDCLAYRNYSSKARKKRDFLKKNRQTIKISEQI
jgi:hypothetical protein